MVLWEFEGVKQELKVLHEMISIGFASENEFGSGTRRQSITS